MREPEVLSRAARLVTHLNRRRNGTMLRKHILWSPAAVLAALFLTFTTACDRDPTAVQDPDVRGPSFATGTLDPGYTGQSILIPSGVDSDLDGRDDFVDVNYTGTVEPAFVVPEHAAWTADIDDAKWIGPTANSNLAVIPPGSYPFTTSFTLPTEFGDPVLNLTTSSDNTLELYLNDVEFGTVPAGTTGEFRITRDWHTDSPFAVGENELKIVLVNAGTSDNPAGLLFKAEVTYAVPPVITGLTVPSDPVSAGTNVSLMAAFTDEDSGDSHTCSVDWGDGATSDGLACDASGGLNATHSYTAAGLYAVSVTVTDSHDLSDTETAATTMVVYDPSAGFVTGGGWILSPDGAMPPRTSTVTVSGVSGDVSTDPDAAYGSYYLRYVGDPAPAGFDPGHNYQWASPRIVTPSPEDGPVTLEGTIDVDEQVVGQVAMIGLLDRADLAAGNTGFQRGAYIYVYRLSATSWRIGVTDGNSEGEIVQTFVTVSDTDLPADGVLNVVFTIDGTADGTGCAVGVSTAPAGCMTLQLTGGSVNATLEDSYGDIKGTDSAVPEFANGAVPGWDDYLGSNVAYTLTVPATTGGSAEGKASFGFVAKYKKGASVPDGNTQFTFQTGDLNFHSTSYDWLLVTGSDYAKFKGEGTINGMGPYRFQLWAGDDDPDTFRIKIWDEVDGAEIVVYDNGMDQPIGGGSIMVHAK